MAEPPVRSSLPSSPAGCPCDKLNPAQDAAECDISYDEAYRLAEGIERSLVRLNLDSQGEFVALINAILVQLESGAPVERVIRQLADALFILAEARGVDARRLRLGQRLETLVERVARGYRDAIQAQGSEVDRPG